MCTHVQQGLQSLCCLSCAGSLFRIYFWAQTILFNCIQILHHFHGCFADLISLCPWSSLYHRTFCRLRAELEEQTATEPGCANSNNLDVIFTDIGGFRAISEDIAKAYKLVFILSLDNKNLKFSILIQTTLFMNRSQRLKKFVVVR